MPIQLDVRVGPAQLSGPLTLYPVFSKAQAAAPYLAGPLVPDDALEINELDGGAQVDTLAVQNLTAMPVLLVEGELVVGAKQDRTLNVSVLLAAGAHVTLPVSCVEAGRWHGGGNFTRSHRMASPDLRWNKIDGVNRSIDLDGTLASDQGQVWRSVDAYVDRLAASAPPPSSAFTEVQESVRATAESIVGDVRPEAGQTGVAAAVGGRVIALDLFDRPETLSAYWDTIVAAYAVDAIDLAGEAPSAPDSAAVADLLARIGELEAMEVEGVDLGRGLHIDDGLIRGSALTWDDVVVHLGVLVGAE